MDCCDETGTMASADSSITSLPQSHTFTRERFSRSKCRCKELAASAIQWAWRMHSARRNSRHVLAKLVTHDPRLLLGQLEVFAALIPDLKYWSKRTRYEWVMTFYELNDSKLFTSSLLNRLSDLLIDIDRPVQTWIPSNARQDKPVVSTDIIVKGIEDAVEIVISDALSRVLQAIRKNCDYELNASSGLKPIVGDHEMKKAAVQLAMRVLKLTKPIPPRKLLEKLLEANLPFHYKKDDFLWLCKEYPQQVFEVLISSPNLSAYLNHLPMAVYKLFGKVKAPRNANPQALCDIFDAIRHIPDKTMPLLASVIEVMADRSSMLVSMLPMNYSELLTPKMVSYGLANDLESLTGYTERLLLQELGPLQPRLVTMSSQNGIFGNGINERLSILPIIWGSYCESLDMEDHIIPLKPHLGTTTPEARYTDVTRLSPVELKFRQLVYHLIYWMLKVPRYIFAEDLELPRDSRQKLGLMTGDVANILQKVRERVFVNLWANESKEAPLSYFDVSMVYLLRSFHDRNIREEFTFSGLSRQFPVLGKQFDIYLQDPSMNKPTSLSHIPGSITESISWSIIMENNVESAVERIINFVPFFLSLSQRMQLLRKHIQLNRSQINADSPLVCMYSVRREELVEDAYHIYYEHCDWRIGLGVRFYRNGLPESAGGGAGPRHELLSLLCEKLFSMTSDRETGDDLFVSTPQNTLISNPENNVQKIPQTSMRNRYEFLGQVVALSIYENLATGIRFSPSVFAMSGYSLSGLQFDDIEYLDEDLYMNLLKLRHLTDTQMIEAGLPESMPKGNTSTWEDTTASNSSPSEFTRYSYVYEYARKILTEQHFPQLRWFFHGFNRIINPDWLGMFSSTELCEVIGGNLNGLDVEDLRANTNVMGFPYSSRTIEYLWSTLRGFSNGERTKFLKFVTAVSHPPLQGFEHLNPSFAIRCSGSDENLLPTSSTCMNTLSLPSYTSEKKLQEKLLLAINFNEGFALE